MSDDRYEIMVGNIYESADPRDDGRQIRITGYMSGCNRASIVSHPSGKNHRSIVVQSLHEALERQDGSPRKRGYFFIGRYQEGMAEKTA